MIAYEGAVTSVAIKPTAMNIPDVGIVAFREQGDYGRTLFGSSEEDEADGSDGSSTYVIGDVANCNMQQSANGL